MRKLLLTGSAVLVLLAACGDREKAEFADDGRVANQASQTAALGGALDFAQAERLAGELDALPQLLAQSPAGQPAPPPPPPPAPDPGAPGQPGQEADTLAQAGALLAYSYGASLELPARSLRAVMAAHEEECRAAGPALCQMLSANVYESGPDYVYGNLSIRAEPQWLAGFRDGLEADAKGADGRMTGETVSAEDLTRYIVDTEARLRAQRILRERLEGLLSTQTDDVGDLLAVERELARVQGDIDSAASQLEMMRRRVDMSTLDISYASAPAPLSSNAFEPLGRAVNEFFAVFAEAAGLIVRFVAFAAPWAIVGVPLVWLLLRWRKARRARKAAASS